MNKLILLWLLLGLLPWIFVGYQDYKKYGKDVLENIPDVLCMSILGPINIVIVLCIYGYKKIRKYYGKYNN